MNRRMICALAGAACLAAAPHAFAQTYTFKTFVYAPGYPVYPDDINDSGQVAGVYLSRAHTQVANCFIKTGHMKQSISDPAGKQTQCYSINRAGAVVGNYVNNGTGVITGFMDANGTFTDIAPPGATTTIASGLSDTGKICGYYNDSAGKQHGFLLVGGTYSTYDVPGALSTACIGINNTGQFTVQAVDSSNHLHGYIHTAGSLREIAFAGASYTAVYRLNNKGQVAAEWVSTAGVGHGGVYDSAKAAYYTIDDPGKTATGILGIDDRAMLTGIFTAPNATYNQAFIAKGHLPP